MLVFKSVFYVKYNRFKGKQSDDRGLVKRDKSWLEFARDILMFRMTWRVCVKNILKNISFWHALE